MKLLRYGAPGREKPGMADSEGNVRDLSKIVKDIDEAHRRAKEWAAPMNARRLNLKTPCAETGECADCSSPQRICNVYSALVKKPSRTDITVLLVGEPLGL